MNVLWYYVIGFIIIWIVAYLLKDKYDIEMDSIVLMFKTQKLHIVIDKIASFCPRVWKYLINIGMPLGVLFMIIMVISLIYSIQIMFETPTVSLILPGVDIPGSPLYIPFLTGLLALATVMIVHEFGHGILARVENVKIDSVGLLLMLIIPGAFVEPNENDVERLNGFSKLRIYFAGPLFNIVLCIIALLLVFSVGGFLDAEDTYTSDGMEIISVVPGSPAEKVLSSGMVITGINNQPVRNYTSYVQSLNNTHIGDNLSIETTNGTYFVITTNSPSNSSKSYIGIRTDEHVVVTEQFTQKYGTILPGILSQIKEFAYWVFLLNFAVGTFNLLPMKPLDGGLILEEILKYRIRPDRKLEFINAFNRYVRFFPLHIREILIWPFKKLLDFMEIHYLNEDTASKVVTQISYLFAAVLIVLVLYGLVPGILQMI